MQVKRYQIASILNVPNTDVCIYRLDKADDGESGISKPVPGQIVFLSMLDEQGNVLERKPYSMASSPSDPQIELCIKLVNGKLTGKLATKKIGDIVGLDGPTGHFTFKGEPKAAFIGGGTGVAPFIGMLRSIEEAKNDALQPRQTVLCYSAKNENSILYRELLERLSRENQGVQVVTTLTKDVGTGWHGERGRIDKDMITRHIPASEVHEYHWWICGPAEMVKTIKASLIELGADAKRLHLEAWG